MCLNSPLYFFTNQMEMRFVCATKLGTGWFEFLGSCWQLFLFVVVFFPLSFACQVQSRAQQNVAVQCTCGEVCGDECVDVCLRVCQDIQPGSELLLYKDAVGKNRATKEQSGHEGNSDSTKNSSDKNFLHI